MSSSIYAEGVTPPRFLDVATPPTVMTLVLMSGLAALNMNIFLPSMPSIAAEFQTDYSVVQLDVSAYLALTGALQLVIGPLSDRFGRRIVLLICMGIFIAATLGCLVAPTIEVFLACRMMQAVVASGILLSRTIVRDMVPMDQAASMIGYVTMGMALVPMIGPTLGGALDTAFGWRASFAALLIFGLLVALLIWRDLGETNKTQHKSFGAQFREYPELMTSRRFWGYALATAFASGAFFSFLGGAPFVASDVLRMSELETGLHFAVIAMGYITGNFLSARFTVRIGIHGMMLAGGMVALFGSVLVGILFLFGLETPFAFFWPMFFVGCGNGMVLPSGNAGLLSVRPRLAGTASGLGGALMIGGGGGLAALTGWLLGPGTGAWPVILMMSASSVLALFAVGYTKRIELEVASAEGA